MHYLDPERPRLHADGGLPLLQGVAGRYALPCLHIAPRGNPTDTRLEISAFFPSGHGGSSRREILLELWEFPSFWQQWLLDPERVAQEKFGWIYEAPRPKLATPKPSASPTITVDELLADL